MESRRLTLALALLAAAVTLAGCIDDLERRHLDANWSADVEVTETVHENVHGAPAMVVVTGEVQLPADANVTVTGLDGELSRENATIPLQAMRVDSEEGTQRAGGAEGGLELSDGETLSVTFAPEDDADRRANPDHEWNASLEVQWRHRDGSAFDAGTLEVESNVTPERVPGLGVGVVDRSEGAVEGLVFSAIGRGELPEAIDIDALRVAGGEVEAIATLQANVTASEGTARLSFDEPFAIPEGSGYVVFRLDEPGGVASTNLVEGEDALPFPGAITAVVALAATGLALRGRS